jgi:CheY-like chemotaxis protein
MTDDKPGQGTTENGAAPVTAEEMREQQDAFIARVQAKLHPMDNSVLIVDDDVHVRRIVGTLIAKASPTVQIVQAINGRDALEKLQDIRKRTGRDPLFIVTDLNMPVMDGWALLTHLRKEYRKDGETQGIPVVVLSASDGEKRSLFSNKSIHSRKFYSPLVSVAKEDCLDPSRYTAAGEQGLGVWIKHFLRYE